MDEDIRAQYLEALDATARAQQALIDRAHTVLRDPKQHSWEESARAAATLPLAGLGAALTELQRAFVTGSLFDQPAPANPTT